MKEGGNFLKWMFVVVLAVPCLIYFQGCSSQRHAVVASTGTNIGVELSENPANQMPQAKLGYNRAELAIVPTNRSTKEDPGGQGGGARDVADVLMELKYNGIFETGADSGIYQRLAVGKEAVRQPGAAFMLAKGLDSSTADKVSAALKSIPSTPEDVTRAQYPIGQAYLHLYQQKKSEFDNAAISEGFQNFDNFIVGKPSHPTLDQVKKVRTALEKYGDIKTKISEFDEKAK